MDLSNVRLVDLESDYYLMFSRPPVRDIYRRESEPTTSGIRCCECDKPVYYVPQYARVVNWRCSACAGRSGVSRLSVVSEYKSFEVSK